MDTASTIKVLLMAVVVVPVVSWVSIVAPRLARATTAKLRASLGDDIQAARDATVDELMPRALSAQALGVCKALLGLVWLIAFWTLWARVGVVSHLALTYTALFAALYFLCLVDIDSQLLPGHAVAAILWAGLLTAALGLVPLRLDMAVFGVAAGWLLFWLPNTVLRYTKPYRVSPVGEGDIALMAACGAWLGPNAVLFSCAVSISAALFLRSALALYSRRYLRQPEPEEDSAGRFVPFGPFISGAAMLLLCLDPFHLFLRIDPFQFFTSIESLHLF